MIKVYVDWGVMSQMKQGHHPELREFLKRKHQLYVIYSTSHISDILVSHNGEQEQEKTIKGDLDYITEITDNWCAFTSKEAVRIRQLAPHDLYQERLEQQQEYGEGGPLVRALRLFEPDSEAFRLIQNYIDSPLPPDIMETYDNPLTAERMRRYYPGLEEAPTVGNLLKLTWQRNLQFNQTDAYADLRKGLQDSLDINKDKMFASAKPFEAMGRAYEKKTEAMGFDLEKLMHNESTPTWFQDVYNNFLLLDLHGFQQDRIKVDEHNKETMRNTIDDGFHAAFGSFCDFYITNDKRSAKKAKEVYQKLKIDTKIYNPVEFVEYAKGSLVYYEPVRHLNFILQMLTSKNYEEVEFEGRMWRMFTFELFLFDYFNKISLIYAPDELGPLILVSREFNTNNDFMLFNDLIAIINKLNVACGSSEMLTVSSDDFDLDKELPKLWQVGKITFRLTVTNSKLQLYLDLPKEVQES
jgi:hypothetical protein